MRATIDRDLGLSNISRPVLDDEAWPAVAGPSLAAAADMSFVETCQPTFAEKLTLAPRQHVVSPALKARNSS